MDEFTAHVLRCLVEGHAARTGLKDRNRALSEFEIARRAGYTEWSYVEFSTTRERDQVRGALDELERAGWATQWDRAGRYDTFVPTELGVRRANTLNVVQDNRGGAPAPDGSATPLAGPVALPRPALVPRAPASTLPPDDPAALPPEAALARLVQQMDEVLGLLRAIAAKLGSDD